MLRWLIRACPPGEGFKATCVAHLKRGGLANSERCNGGRVLGTAPSPCLAFLAGSCISCLLPEMRARNLVSPIGLRVALSA
jgi:hypothetical protein